jgi:hypothetical protein
LKNLGNVKILTSPLSKNKNQFSNHHSKQTNQISKHKTQNTNEENTNEENTKQINENTYPLILDIHIERF